MEEAKQEEPVNPYQAPETDVRGGGRRRSRRHGGAELANPWTRLVASLVDGVVLGVVVLPAMFLMGAFDFREESFGDTVVTILVGLGAYAAVNGYLLAKRGQTVGKMMMSVKIVRVDNSAASFGQVFGLRHAMLQVFNLVPIAGIFWLIDALFIFRSGHHCIHDLIAGTKVVKT